MNDIFIEEGRGICKWRDRAIFSQHHPLRERRGETKSVLTVPIRPVVVKSDSGTKRRRTKGSADRSIGCVIFRVRATLFPRPTRGRCFPPRCGRFLPLVSRAEPDQPGIMTAPAPSFPFFLGTNDSINQHSLVLHLTRIKWKPPKLRADSVISVTQREGR